MSIAHNNLVLGLSRYGHPLESFRHLCGFDESGSESSPICICCKVHVSSKISERLIVRDLGSLFVPYKFCKVFPDFGIGGKSEALVICHFGSDVMEVLAASLHDLFAEAGPMAEAIALLRSCMAPLFMLVISTP